VLKGAARKRSIPSYATLVVQSLFYVASGINHFWHENFYLHIMPDHYAHPLAVVKPSGVGEIPGGLGLLPPATRHFSAVGIAVMPVVFFDVHIFVLSHPGRYPEVAEWVLWARLPPQFALIAWAFYYARRPGERSGS